MVNRLSTGIEPLDRVLGRGIKPGSVVALCAPPASQCELILEELARQRDTLYITTTRTSADVERRLRNCAGIDMSSVGVKYVDPSDSVIEDVLHEAKRPPEEANVIIDIADPIEWKEPERIINFYQQLKNHMENINGIAILNCMKTDNAPNGRDMTVKMSDLVLELEISRDGQEMPVFLTIPKYRGGNFVKEPLKLELGEEEVGVDTSRDIA